ncbi:MAG: alkylation repair enzyme AlkD [Bacteroidota bacterium]|jgi:3-methyladenine DNA glycosylase AlkD
MTLVDQLYQTFTEHRKPEQVEAMENYMKNNFRFLGLKTDSRRSLFTTWFKQHESAIRADFRAIAKMLFNQPYRELQYCGMEVLLGCFKKNYQKEDIELIEYFLVTNAWWDSVDPVAKYLLGGYLLAFPEEKSAVIERFSAADHLWLNRSAIIFQLSYKAKTDFDVLKAECYKHKDSKEFFIQKAIGWALRDYSRFNPEGVRTFVENTDLKPLSKREALRNLP